MRLISVGLPSDIIIPSPVDRICSPPPWTIGLYEHHIVFGLKVPASPYFVKVLAELKLSPGQFTPVSVAQLIAFEALLISLGFTDVSPAVFLHFFSVSRSWQGSWLTFKGKAGRRVFDNPPSKLEGWRKRFFFLPSSHDPRLQSRWGTWVSQRARPPSVQGTEGEAVAQILSLIAFGPLDLLSFLRPLIPALWRETLVPEPVATRFEMDVARVSRVMSLVDDVQINPDQPGTSSAGLLRRSSRKRIRRSVRPTLADDDNGDDEDDQDDLVGDEDGGDELPRVSAEHATGVPWMIPPHNMPIPGLSEQARRAFLLPGDGEDPSDLRNRYFSSSLLDRSERLPDEDYLRAFTSSHPPRDIFHLVSQPTDDPEIYSQALRSFGETFTFFTATMVNRLRDRDEVSRLRKELSQTNQGNSQLAVDLSRARDDLLAAQQESLRLGGELDGTRGQLSDLRAQHDAQTSELSRMMSDLTMERGETSRLRAAVEERDSGLAHLREEHRGLEQRERRVRSHRDDIRRRLRTAGERGVSRYRDSSVFQREMTDAGSRYFQQGCAFAVDLARVKYGIDLECTEDDDNNIEYRDLDSFSPLPIEDDEDDCTAPISFNSDVSESTPSSEHED